MKPMACFQTLLGGTPPGAEPGHRWYVRLALEARRIGTVALAGLVFLAGCGGGERQDANEPDGNYKVEVTRLSFPKQQRLAQVSELVVGVRNAGEETIPNVAVTVHGFNYDAASGEGARAVGPEPPPLRRQRHQRRHRRLSRGQGRDPQGLRHRLRRHLGLRTAEARPREDLPLVGDGGQGRSLQARHGASRPASTARRARSASAAARPSAARSAATWLQEAPQVKIGEDGKTVVEADEPR